MLINETGPLLRADQFRGREHLVAPVRAMKAMYLDNGYVPAEHVEKSALAWNGTPVTLNHPNGVVSTANAPEVADKTWLGYFFNTEYVPEEAALDGELWIDTEQALTLGEQAETVVETLENGKSLSVSTAYFADPLDPGRYDGKHRNNVVGNLRPDHLAILPNGDGKCSIDDGCMAGVPAINSADFPALSARARLRELSNN